MNSRINLKNNNYLLYDGHALVDYYRATVQILDFWLPSPSGCSRDSRRKPIQMCEGSLQWYYHHIMHLTFLFQWLIVYHLIQHQVLIFF